MVNKPTELYHGSFTGIEGPLTPRPSTGDLNGYFPDGSKNLVFASSNKDTCMLYALKSSPKHILSVEHGKTNIAIGTDYDEWREALQGASCTLYTLPSDTFNNTVRQFDNIPTDEWTSSTMVQPLRSERVTPEDVMRTGGQLIFLQPEIDGGIWSEFMRRILKHRDEGYDPKEFTGVHMLYALQDAGLIQHYLNAEENICPIEFVKSERGSVLIKDDIAWLQEQVTQRRILYEGEETKLRRQQQNRLNIAANITGTALAFAAAALIAPVIATGAAIALWAGAIAIGGFLASRFAVKEIGERTLHLKDSAAPHSSAAEIAASHSLESAGAGKEKQQEGWQERIGPRRSQQGTIRQIVAAGTSDVTSTEREIGRM